MNSIPWETIIPLIVSLVQDCIKNGEDEQEIRQRIRRPRGFARMRLERKMRQSLGYSRSQWRVERGFFMEEVYSEAARATDGDLDELIAEAKED